MTINPISFDPYLGWVDITDPDNVPEGVRTINASDLLRYENLGSVSADRINQLITAAATVAAPAWADITGKPPTFTPATHTHAGGDIALASTTQPGALSAADKTKLDNATAAATASRVVIRDGAGRAAFAAPSASGDAATKGYVDGLFVDTGWLTVALRSPWTQSTAFGSTGLKLRVKNGTAFLNGRIENTSAWLLGDVLVDEIESLNAAVRNPTNRAVGVNCIVQTDGVVIVTVAGGPGGQTLSCSWPT
jgi:hypothetical protein